MKTVLFQNMSWDLNMGHYLNMKFSYERTTKDVYLCGTWLTKGNSSVIGSATLSDCDNWGWIRLNTYVVSSMHSWPLQELINKEACCSFRITYIQLFYNNNMRNTFLSKLWIICQLFHTTKYKIPHKVW